MSTAPVQVLGRLAPKYAGLRIAVGTPPQPPSTGGDAQFASSTGWAYDERSGRYRDMETGEYLTPDQVLQLRNDFVETRRAGMVDVSRQLASDVLSPEEWLAAMRAEVKMAIGIEYAFGRGGILAMRSSDWQRVQHLVEEQWEYLDNFAQDIDDGDVTPAQLLQRAGMYSDAGVRAFEEGQSAAWEIDLPEYPGQRCEGLTNCRCYWSLIENDDGSVDATWIAVGDANTCGPCDENAEQYNPLHFSAYELQFGAGAPVSANKASFADPAAVLAYVQQKLDAVAAEQARFEWDPNQPRDEGGRWTDGGGGGGGKTAVAERDVLRHRSPIIRTVKNRPYVMGHIKALLGRDVPLAEVASLTGAPDNAEVDFDVYSTAPNEGLIVMAHHPDLEMPATVRLMQDRDTKELKLRYEYLYVKDWSKGQGKGVQIMAQAVANAERLGIPKVDMHAVGEGPMVEVGQRGGATGNGYYTWARMGFDTDIGNQQLGSAYGGRMRTANFPPEYRDVKTLNELMQRPGGAAYWKGHGWDNILSIDTAKDSPGRKILDGYLKEKGLATYAETGVPDRSAERSDAPDKRRGVDAPELSDEDEAILDRLWRTVEFDSRACADPREGSGPVSAGGPLPSARFYSDDQPRDDAGRWTDGGGSSGGTTTAERPRAPRIGKITERARVEENVRAALGRDASMEELATLVGAPEDAEVNITAYRERGYEVVAVYATHPDIEDEAVAVLFPPGRYAEDFEPGKTARLHYEQLYLKPEARGSGRGVQMMAQSVANAERLGIPYVDLYANGNGPSYYNPEPGGTDNGYYTWARMGFDSELGDYTKSKWPSEQRARFGDVGSISELLQRPGGRDFWKQYGGPESLWMKTDAGSHGRQIMDAYLKEKGLATYASDVRPSADGNGANSPQPSAEAPPRGKVGSIYDPTPENEAILDRIWERLAAQADFYSDDQPRDEAGRWTDGGGGAVKQDEWERAGATKVAPEIFAASGMTKPTALAFISTDGDVYEISDPMGTHADVGSAIMLARGGDARGSERERREAFLERSGAVRVRVYGSEVGFESHADPNAEQIAAARAVGRALDEASTGSSMLSIYWGLGGRASGRSVRGYGIGQVLRQLDTVAARFADEPEEGEGHGVTINGNPVYIGGDGTILKGAERLVGKKVGELRQEGRAKEGSQKAREALREVPHTRGEPDGDGSMKHPIAVGDDLERAARLIAEGKHVRLDQPQQISTLLDKMAADVDDARAKGAKAPQYDLGKVTVKGTNLFTLESKDIPRVQMPQLKGQVVPGSPASKIADARGNADISDALLKELREQGIRTTGANVPAATLRATQRDLDGAKVAGMVKSMKAGTLKEEAIFVSRDNYVIDGHHRWAAKIGIDLSDNKLGNVRQRVIRVDADIGEVLDLTREFAREMGVKQAAAFNLAEWFLRALRWARRGRPVAEFYSEDQPRDENGRWTGDGGGSSAVADRPAGGQRTSTGRSTIRSVGWKVYDSSMSGRPTELRVHPDAIPEELNRASETHVYRGITAAEAASIAETARVQSTLAYSHSSEGTSFADIWADAESAVNYGRDNPARTSQPTYVIEVERGPDIVVDRRDYWPKAAGAVPAERISRVWQFTPGGTIQVGEAGLDDLRSLVKDSADFYSEDQPRDEGGRWTSDGGGSPASSGRPADRPAPRARTRQDIYSPEKEGGYVRGQTWVVDPDGTMRLKEEGEKVVDRRDPGANTPYFAVQRRGDGTAYIGEMYVPESKRGQGLGQRMYQEMARWADRGGYELVSGSDRSESAERALRAAESKGMVEVLPAGEVEVIRLPERARHSATFEFDENQPRDERGRWTSDGGGGDGKAKDDTKKDRTARTAEQRELVDNMRSITAMPIYAQERVLKMATGWDVDLEGLDPAESLPAVKSLAQLGQDYPDALVDNVQAFEEEPGYGWVRTALAQYQRSGVDGGSIGLNPDNFGTDVKDWNAARESIASSSATGWFAPEAIRDPVGYLAAHEYGHAIHHEIYNRDARSIAGWMALHPPSESMSTYSTQNANEQFAEAFAAYYYGSDHPHAQSMGEFLKDHYGSAPRMYTEPPRVQERTLSREESESILFPLSAEQQREAEVNRVLKSLGGNVTWVTNAADFYSEDQPRDEAGRWTSDGGGGGKAEDRPAGREGTLTPKAYTATEARQLLEKPEEREQARGLALDEQRDRQEILLKNAMPGRPNVNLGKLDPVAMETTTTALARLGQDYPLVSEKIVMIGDPREAEAKWGMDRMPPTAAAGTASNPSTGESAIGFNQNFYGTSAERTADLRETVIETAKRGWAPPEAARYGEVWTAIHEFGHVVAADMQVRDRDAFNAINFEMRTSDHVSVYGSTSPHENFAETFATYYTHGTEGAAVDMGFHLRQVYGSAPKADPSLAMLPPLENPPSVGQAVRQREADERTARILGLSADFEWDPNQPRDEAGRWTDAGGGGGGTATAERPYRAVALTSKPTWHSPRTRLDTSALTDPRALDPPGLPRALAEQRLLDLYDRAVEQGHADRDANWYVDKHNQIGEWAEKIAVDRQRFSDAVAATSPLTAWNLPNSPRLPNLEAARAMVLVDRAHPNLSPEQIREITPRTGGHPFLGNSAENAIRALRGENPDQVFRAPKIRNFANNLSHPEASFDVTADTHVGRAMLDLHADTPENAKAVKAMMEGRKTGRGPDAQTVGGYGWAADRVREAAADRNMLPSAFQAVIWEQWRREGGAQTTKRAAKMAELTEEMDLTEEDVWALWQDVIEWAEAGAPADWPKQGANR